MAHKYPSSWKNCATCSYWLGDRQPDTFGMGVTVDAPDAKGKCWCLNGPWPRMEKGASQSCAKYHKWIVLR